MDHALHSKGERAAALKEYLKKSTSGVCPINPATVQRGGALDGKCIVFTGALSFPRADATALAKAAGATILPRQFTNDKATEFQSILTAFKDSPPDVIFYGGADPQSAPMVVQMKRLGIKSQFLSGEMTKNPNFIKVAGENAEGVMASLAG